jgi:hypothetical protein
VDILGAERRSVDIETAGISREHDSGACREVAVRLLVEWIERQVAEQEAAPVVETDHGSYQAQPVGAFIKEAPARLHQRASQREGKPDGRDSAS